MRRAPAYRFRLDRDGFTGTPPTAMTEHTLDTDSWTCSCGEETWTPEALNDHLAEIRESTGDGDG